MHIGRTSSIAPDFTKAKLAAARLFAYMDTEPNIDVMKQEGKMLVRLHDFNENITSDDTLIIVYHLSVLLA